MCKSEEKWRNQLNTHYLVALYMVLTNLLHVLVDFYFRIEIFSILEIRVHNVFVIEYLIRLFIIVVGL